MLFAQLGTPSFAASYDDTYKLFLEGKYEEAQEVAAAEVERGVWNRRWPELLIRCHLTRGQYADALKQYDAALERFPTSLTLRMLGIEALRYNGQTDRVGQEIAKFAELLQSGQLQYASRDTLIAAGRYFAMRGEDARQILELFYDRVRESDPTFIEAYIATAELALDKGDFAVAADTLQKAKRNQIRNPTIEYLLARSFENSDSKIASGHLEAALTINPQHIPSLQMLAEGHIDRENYDEAKSSIKKILALNPSHPEAIALQAVLAHLEGDFETEKKLRDKALKPWPQNPEVDHLIGKKLSQKYRFAEGAEYQRIALTLDPKHSAASFQLAQDLLRLGSDDVGWKLAETVADDDPYNVVAYNLMTLKDRIKGFEVLKSGDIHVKMESREAKIYGDAVLKLLTEARKTLCEKYEMQPDAPIVVEIYPEQKDFAIRTFGLPGGAGFLGVCFGKVITANSPASQGARPANWKSVLWHEFCHVVTLEKTKNRMPRWLSEGISVYEERLRDPSWGQSMSPKYREMILGDDLTKVSELSGAFLNPPSGLHLQFAYYESSLVVEFLVDKYGHESLVEILTALSSGMPINDALSASVGSIDKLDFQFAEYARKKAESFAEKADWTREGFPEEPNHTNLTKWLAEHPNSYWGHLEMAKRLLAERDYSAAQTHLEKLASLGAATTEQGGVMELLAQIYEETNSEEKQRKTLVKLATDASDSLPALRRLIKLEEGEENWKAVSRYAKKALAIQPFMPEFHQAFVDASLKLDQPRQAIGSLKALAALDPIDPAGLEFKMARTLAAIGDNQNAKRHVLMALDQAPRYRDAQKLLLSLVESQSTESLDESDQEAAENPAPDSTQKPNENSKVKSEADADENGEQIREEKDDA